MGSGASALINTENTPEEQAKLREAGRAKFDELDKDGSGLLENAELLDVAAWVISSFGEAASSIEDAKMRMMQRLDTNKDGKLDFEEFFRLFSLMTARFALIDRAKVKFQELDKDESGYLESAEIDECVKWALELYQGEDPVQYKKRLMKKVDTNRDGKIDLIEFTVLFEEMLARMELLQSAKKKFNELDVDSSGFLETSEIDHLLDIILASYVEKSDEENRKFKSTLISRIDTNKDGKLDLSEFTRVWEEVVVRSDLIEQARIKFNSLDKDKSGFLEKQELAEVLIEWASTCKSTIEIDVDAACTELIASVDVNGDGKLDLLEFVVIFEATMAQSGVY